MAEIQLGPNPRGAVIVVCDAGRLSEADEVLNGLAEHGYESIAADLAQLPPTPPNSVEAVSAVLDRLSQRGWQHQQSAIVGYGVGAGVALRAAARYPLAAAVSVAAAPQVLKWGSLEQTLSVLQTPWLGLIGEPTATSAEELSIADRANPCAAAVYTEVVRYPGAAEGFYRDTAGSHAHAAAFDSWQRTVEWLNLRVMPRLTPATLAWRAALAVDAAPI